MKLSKNGGISFLDILGFFPENRFRNPNVSLVRTYPETLSFP